MNPKTNLLPTLRRAAARGALLLLLAGAAGCAHCPLCGAPWGGEEPAPVADAGPARAVVRGSAITLERVTLLPTYRLVVRMVDLASGATVAERSESGLSAFPWTFELEYSTDAVLSKPSYGLIAELCAGEEVLFRTDTQYPVAAGRDAQVGEMILVRRR